MTTAGNDDAAARTRALAARLVRQSLDAPAAHLAACHVLDVGVQDSGPGTAEAALALRVEGGASAVSDALEAGDLVSVFSLRGAPHLHRRSDVAALRAALVPASLDDLEATTGPLPESVRQRDDPVAEVARAVDDAMGDHETQSKSDLSGATTARLDSDLTPWCVPCATHHVFDGLFRLATLRAGLHLVSGGRLQTFARLGVAGAELSVSAREAAASRRALLAQATWVATPADVDQVAAWLGWHRSTVRASLAGSSSRPGRAPENARTARLLPVRDVWLRGSDRAWLLGDRVGRRGDVFRALSAPGVVLVAGEILGTWRQRTAGSRNLTVEVDAWTRLTTDQRDQLERDACVVAATRSRQAQISW